MQRMLVGVMVCWVLCMPGSSRAQAGAPEPSGDEAAHAALRALKNDMEQALNAQDMDRLLSHVTNDVIFTTMNNDVIMGKDAIRAYYDKMRKGPDRVVDQLTAKFEVDALTRLYGSTGLAQGSSEDHYVLSDGTDLVIHGRWSCALVKESGVWRIASFHYSTNVFDNPVLTKVKHLALGLGVAAALVALVLGFGLGRFTARRGRA